MVNFTAPVTTTFELQRKTLEQSHAAVTQTVEAQQTWNEAVLDGVQNQEEAGRRLVELNQDAVHTTLDAVEENVPGVDGQLSTVREAVDEQFDSLLENQEEAYDAITSELAEGTAALDDLSEDYLSALEEQISLLVEAHEEVETQSVATVEQLAEEVEELQEQAEEIQAQLRETGEEAVEGVSA